MLHKVKNLLVCSFLALTLQEARATAQETDTIRIGGQKYSLNTNPLDEYLANSDWHIPERALIWSSNWRGYLATWEIKDDSLFLIDATIRIKNKATDNDMEESIVVSLFSTPAPIRATWYSGAIVIPDGEVIQYVHMGYGSTYSHYQVFRVAHGRITTHLSLTSQEFSDYRERKFSEFRKTKEFRKAYAEMKRDGGSLTDDQKINFIRNFYADRYLAL